jgi:hypothetical protein
MFRRALVMCLTCLGCATATSGADIDAGPADGRRGGGVDVFVIPADASTEVCNGRDDNGNGFIDEGSAVSLCGVVANGTPVCHGAGGCAIDSCSPGWYDLDGLFNTGCECTSDPMENGSMNCGDAVQLGNINDDGTKIVESGNIVPVGDVDYYAFHAVDSTDNTCDNFHVRVFFLTNPNNEFTLDMWKGGCGGQEICSGTDDIDWYTNFKTQDVPPTGECPCTTINSGVDNTTNQCVDDSSDFVVRVSRTSGVTPTCSQYSIEISNGAYPPPP